MLREIFCQAYPPEILTFRIPKAQAMMGLQRNRPLVSLSNQFIGLRSTPARLALPC
jgi:hypothetical protein